MGTVSNSFILNSVDLVNKVKSLKLNYDFQLISFDVKSLFTNVPLDDVLSFLPEVLGSSIEGIPVSNFVDLIKLCVKDSYFNYNGQFYSQVFGMSMGNPLSPVLANLYMEFFETRLLSRIKEDYIVWYRYMDDILCLWPCNKDVDEFLIELNTLSPTIKFTIETESCNSIPFLDVKIHRQDSGLLKTSVYRKPTNNCSYVHFYSNHHINVKKSVFISMFLRAFKICDADFIENELECLKNIGIKLRYPTEILETCLKTAKTKYNAQNITNVDNTESNSEINNSLKTIVLPYNEKLVDVCKPLRALGVRVAFSYVTVKNRIISHKPNDIAGGVYKIPCKDCDQVYVGQTGKALEKRINQYPLRVCPPFSWVCG